MELALTILIGYVYLLFPLAGLVWMGLRRERKRNERILRTMNKFARRIK